MPEDVKTKVEAKAKELKEAIPTDDVAKVRRRRRRPAPPPLQPALPSARCHPRFACARVLPGNRLPLGAPLPQDASRCALAPHTRPT